LRHDGVALIDDGNVGARRRWRELHLGTQQGEEKSHFASVDTGRG
jgi:hypothetical protein